MSCRTVGDHSHCFSVRRDPIVGRYACADRDIAPLEVVLAELPAVVTPQTRHGAVCLVCLRKPKEMDCCMECGLPVCGGEDGAQCRDEHPSMPECKVFSKSIPLRERMEQDKKEEAEIRAKLEVNGHDAQVEDTEDNTENRRFAWHALPFASVGAIRYLDHIKQLKKAREEEKDWEKFDETSGCYDDLEELEALMDHASDLASDSEVAPHLDRLCDYLSTADLAPSDIRRAAGVIRTNAFGYTTKQGGEGAALFARISLLSHSCQPNLQHVQDAKTGIMSLVAQRAIKKGEELAVTYINQFQGPTDRRRLLRGQWYFDCLCSRCKDPTECGTCADAIKCPECISNVKEGEKVMMMKPKNHVDVDSEWLCERGHKLSAEDVDKLEKSALSGWLQVDQTSPSAVEDFLRDVCVSRLGEGNHFSLKIKSHLVILMGLREKKDNATRDREKLTRRLKLCQDVVNYLWKIDPEQTRKLGVFLLEQNRPAMLLSKLDFEEERISRTEYLLRLSSLAKMEKKAKTILGYYNDNFGKEAGYLISNLSYPGDNLQLVEQ